MSEYAVTAIGRDRPGIVAAVAGVLHEHGGNLEDSAMTILGGQFSMMLLVELPGELADLVQSLDAATADLGLIVHVEPVTPGAPPTDATHVLSVYGGDQPGLVARITGELAAAGANITDLSTRVLGTDEQPVYAMIFELVLDDEQAVATAVATVCHELDVDHSLRAFDTETY